MMKQLRFFQRLLPLKLSESTVRSLYIVLLGLGLLLCAPLLDRTHDGQVPQRPAPAASDPEQRFGVKLRRGDTLLSVLTRVGLKAPSAHGMIEQVRPFLNPKRMRPGHDVQIVVNKEDRTVQAVELVIDNSLVRVKSTAEGWLAERHEIPFVRATRVVRGSIKDTLYQSGIEAGLTPQHILDLAQIFEYDIDFFSDFQRGDSFGVAIEKIRYADGRHVWGRILAAELEANGDPFSAFYYVAKDGTGSYYDSQGHAVRRSFLRAPLSYARISSPFSVNRRHPIFRTVRPHRAIDYAAPQGTPVVAIGKGRVEFAGRRHGYGNLVEIRHAASYVTRYAHFSRFAAGIRTGKLVNQGEVIGYVGQTGHATGPHLHFEFLRGGEKINFLDLRIEKTDRLVDDDLRRFEQMREKREALLRNAEVELVGADQS